LILDPPPDLVIEVDITSPSLDKFPIYARMGIPEIWRHDCERLAIFDLRGEEYIKVAESRTSSLLRAKPSPGPSRRALH
jgi:Uma2 family endonuclease